MAIILTSSNVEGPSLNILNPQFKKQKRKIQRRKKEKNLNISMPEEATNYKA